MALTDLHDDGRPACDLYIDGLETRWPPPPTRTRTDLDTNAVTHRDTVPKRADASPRPHSLHPLECVASPNSASASARASIQTPCFRCTGSSMKRTSTKARRPRSRGADALRWLQEFTDTSWRPKILTPHLSKTCSCCFPVSTTLALVFRLVLALLYSCPRPPSPSSKRALVPVLEVDAQANARRPLKTMRKTPRPAHPPANPAPTPAPPRSSSSPPHRPSAVHCALALVSVSVSVSYRLLLAYTPHRKALHPTRYASLRFVFLPAFLARLECLERVRVSAPAPYPICITSICPIGAVRILVPFDADARTFLFFFLSILTLRHFAHTRGGPVAVPFLSPLLYYCSGSGRRLRLIRSLRCDACLVAHTYRHTPALRLTPAQRPATGSHAPSYLSYMHSGLTGCSSYLSIRVLSSTPLAACSCSPLRRPVAHVPGAYLI
ncbi:hypothetical protein C8R45DRAFT_538777 [Mycena sanguinolenta]|nr:hypothetical protein C8R45DRAFT_1114524 [Mycena sanguinolenta]KAJ6461118.1 hypothetical protein C8R45DRAFT_538777 [Mycena sanguinolenta]